MSLNKEVEAYITELNRNYDAGVNRSHETLHKLYSRFGKSAVDAEVDRQIAAAKTDHK